MTLMGLPMFAGAGQLSHVSLTRNEASLYRACEHVEDGREKKWKRYPFALLFTLIFLGTLAGQTKLETIIAWRQERKMYLKHALQWPKDVPAQKTSTSALSKCDEREVVKARAQVLMRARAEEQGEEEEKEGTEKLIHTI